MFIDQARISPTDSLHTLVILVHTSAAHGRGLLLLSASETETRIKHLDGFVAVSFFINEAQDTVAEYVQWRSAAHLAAAFRHPEFNEHLPVLEHLATAEVGFYSLEHAVTSDRLPTVLGPSFSGTADFQILTAQSGEMDGMISRVEQWADAAVGRSTGVRSVAIHADRDHSKLALFMHHDPGSGASAWYSEPGAVEIDRARALTRYTTVSAPAAKGTPMRYVMTSTGKHKPRGS